jgi:brefeldin A-resistance guanine nucleotide exchange factor 1
MDITDVSGMELPVILAPFFAIIRSSLSTGPITAAALSALHSFFVCGLISSSSIALETALVEMSSAVSHCKFEASDSSGDEVVLLKIMAVIQDCLCGTVGRGLGDIEVCEMLETVLTTCCQMRLSGEWNPYFIHTLSFWHRDTSPIRGTHNACSGQDRVL